MNIDGNKTDKNLKFEILTMHSAPYFSLFWPRTATEKGHSQKSLPPHSSSFSNLWSILFQTFARKISRLQRSSKLAELSIQVLSPIFGQFFFYRCKHERLSLSQLTTRNHGKTNCKVQLQGKGCGRPREPSQSPATKRRSHYTHAQLIFN